MFLKHSHQILLIINPPVIKKISSCKHELNSIICFIKYGEVVQSIFFYLRVSYKGHFLGNYKIFFELYKVSKKKEILILLGEAYSTYSNRIQAIN